MDNKKEMVVMGAVVVSAKQFGFNKDTSLSLAAGIGNGGMDVSDEEFESVYDDHLAGFFGENADEELVEWLTKAYLWVSDDIGRGCDDWCEEFFLLMRSNMAIYSEAFLIERAKEALSYDMCPPAGWGDDWEDTDNGPKGFVRKSGDFIPDYGISFANFGAISEIPDREAMLDYLANGKYRENLIQLSLFKGILTGMVDIEKQKEEIRRLLEIYEKQAVEQIGKPDHEAYLLAHCPGYQIKCLFTLMLAEDVREAKFNGISVLYKELFAVLDWIEEAGIPYLPAMFVRALEDLKHYYFFAKLPGMWENIPEDVRQTERFKKTEKMIEMLK